MGLVCGVVLGVLIATLQMPTWLQDLLIVSLVTALIWAFLARKR